MAGSQPQELLHERADFQELLAIVAEEVGVGTAFVEKDYWVVHTLWSLEQAGLSVSFKGGTSLSKGYGLIQRFSEDIDVKVTGESLPSVSSWTSEGTTATGDRQRFFEALHAGLDVPGAKIKEVPGLRDRTWRSAVFAVEYEPQGTASLSSPLRPHVQLEVGSARVTPGETRPISSWVHDRALGQGGQAVEAVDNRPSAIHCVRPDVTLLEKIEAIARRFPRSTTSAASFVRHYEDIHRIAEAGKYSHEDLAGLLGEMEETGDIRHWPDADDAAWNPEAHPDRWGEVREAWQAIGPLYWGERTEPETCASRIRELVREMNGAREEA